MLAVDLENLLGRWACEPWPGLVTEVERLFGVLPRARFVTVAGHRKLLARTLAVLPPWALRRPAVGAPDEADALLLHDLQDVPTAVHHVVIASGDHGFVDACQALRASGRTVEVVARHGCLSRRLAEAADLVTTLPAARATALPRA